MKYTQLKTKNLLFILIAALSLFLTGILTANAGMYTDSAHGDEAGGVNRSALGYPIGFCDNCHEQHASIGGTEPAPTTGTSPSIFSLFYYPISPSQADNFCFQCHTDMGGYQNLGIIKNLTYSYRAGRWSDLVNDILEVFSYTSPGTSHNLDNISTFITGKWSYTADSNPCNACHNPHAAQGDPQGNGAGTTDAKTTSVPSRGWPVSRPSQHSTDNNAWGLWGDDAGEKMSDYASSLGDTYQAPYKYNNAGAPVYEPDGSGTTNGSNLADYVTICTDCHNASNAIYSTTLQRYLYQFDWGADKHGGKDAVDDFFDDFYAACNTDLYTCPGNPGPCLDCSCDCPDTFDDIDDIISPYAETTLNYVLACTDCHEPHGSPNRFLIRVGVNGGTSPTEVTTLSSPDDAKEWKTLCSKCHGTTGYSLKFRHHDAHYEEFGPDGYQNGQAYNYTCKYCHYPIGNNHRNCTKCHYHGSTKWTNWPGGALGDWDYVDKMF